MQSPCYRCKRLDIPCLVRQTILGRPGPGKCRSADSRPARTAQPVSRLVIELPSRTRPSTTQDDADLIIPRTRPRSFKDQPPSQGDIAHCREDALLLQTPQSSETVFIIRAIDTLRCEKVEQEWFRHLPAHVGHTPALDLSIKAIVAACAYGRGVPRLTSADCYHALALALNAVQATIKQSQRKPDDDILASTALLAPFEGAIKKNGIPTRLHLEGLAAILAARPAVYPVTPLSREILDFYISESAIIAYVQSTPSPFESVARAYFANDRVGYSDSDRAQLKDLGHELFIRLPTLVKLVRSLRVQRSLQRQPLLDALRLLDSLFGLQDPQAEERLLRDAQIRFSSDPDAPSPFRQSFHFASVKDFEALASYWQTRLALLRLEAHLNNLIVSSAEPAERTSEPGTVVQPSFGPRTDEMSRLVKNILMCSVYAAKLPLRKQDHLFAHAMLVVWGVKMDMGCKPDGEDTSLVSDLLLRRVSIALGLKPDLTVEDMDTAADIFVGGQAKGRFAELYSL